MRGRPGGQRLLPSEFHTELVRHSETQSVDILIRVKTGDRAHYAPPSISIKDPSPIPESRIAGATGWKSWLPFRGWRPVTASRTNDGLSRIQRIFQKKNYLMAQTLLEKMDYHPQPNTATPYLRITPGKEVSVITEGAGISQGKLQRLIPVYQEKAVDRDLAVEGMRNLKRYQQGDGYFDAHVDFKMQQDVKADRNSSTPSIAAGDIRWRTSASPATPISVNRPFANAWVSAPHES